MLDDSPDVLATLAGVCASCGASWVVDEDELTVELAIYGPTGADCPRCVAWVDAMDRELRARGCRPRDG